MPAAEARAASRRERRGRLRDIIHERSLLRDGDFVLASGRKSPVFFDMKMTVLDPEGAALIAEAVLDLIEDDPAELIGGLELGAVPIVAAVCVMSAGRRPIRGFIVRKAKKGHGTDRLIDGPIREGARAVVVEDVTTTGGSALQAVEAARAKGCRVDKAITIVDRLEGAVENLAKHGVALESLFTMRDFTD